MRSKPPPCHRRPIEDVYHHIGRVCQARAFELGLTQQAIATKMGWTRASIANIEAGKQRVMLHDLPRLAAALQLPASALLPTGFLR